MADLTHISSLEKLVADGRMRFRTASAFVAGALRSAILTGAIEPGTALRQDELATVFDVSRMPIREALRQLEAEGLIDFKPHKGAVVTVLMAHDAGEIYEMRSMAETFALRISLGTLTDSALDSAEAVQEQMEREKDVMQWGILNEEFHRILYSGVERVRLSALIGTLNASVDPYIRFLLKNLNYVSQSHNEHRQLLAACRARDVNAAVEILNSHLTNGGKALTEFLREREAARS